MEPTFYADYYRHENSHWWFRWRFELITGIVGRLRAARPSPDGLRILDAGCGTGQMLQHLGRYGQAVGIDTSPEAIRFASSRGADRLVLGSVARMPFAPETFDCVLSLDVIEHVEDDEAMVRSLYEVVKPGGHLIITVPAFTFLWSSHDVVNWHKRRYRAPELRRLVEGMGLEVERLTYCNTALFAPIWLARKVKNARAALSGRSHAAVTADEADSDLRQLPGPLNAALFRLLQAENRLMRRMNLPFGVSLLVVSRKPVSAEASPPRPSADSIETPTPPPIAAVPDLVPSGTETVAPDRVAVGAGAR